MNEVESGNQAVGQECESLPTYSRGQVFVSNLPYIAMTVLGAAVFAAGLVDPVWRWITAGAYAAYGALGALWIMVFVCPYCHFWDTSACPCGYGRIAAGLVDKKDGDQFKAKFRKHIPVIVPLWFVPVLAAVFILVRSFSWPLLALLVAFAVDAFIVLPLFSKKHGCVNCPQKDSCPWMGSKSE
ncbi:MAG: hypothetical protein ACYTBJ_09260 [Planctomycetota bacterium]|jgi:hypothetical protein